MLRLILRTTLLVSAVLYAPLTVAAESYPTRPITVIVPFPAGAAGDFLARALQPGVSADLGQSIIVDDRPGAGGDVGIGAVARAAPDGYTIGLAATGTLAVNPHLKQSMPFDPIKDLAPVTLVAKTPFVMVAWPNGPAKSIAEVISVAGTKPDALAIGHGGNGTAMHLGAALFLQSAQIKMPLVAYRGNAPVTNDVVGGHLPLAVLDLTSSQQLVDNGKLLALAVMSGTRLPTLPRVPTMAESGLSGFGSVVGWFGLVAPADTPAAIIDRLNVAFVKALHAKGMAEKLASVGTEAAPSTPEAFKQYIGAESERWRRVVAAAGIKE